MFSVISRTVVRWGCSPLRRDAVGVFHSSSRQSNTQQWDPVVSSRFITLSLDSHFPIDKLRSLTGFYLKLTLMTVDSKKSKEPSLPYLLETELFETSIFRGCICSSWNINSVVQDMGSILFSICLRIFITCWMLMNCWMTISYVMKIPISHCDSKAFSCWFFRQVKHFLYIVFLHFQMKYWSIYTRKVLAFSFHHTTCESTCDIGYRTCFHTLYDEKKNLTKLHALILISLFMLIYIYGKCVNDSIKHRSTNWYFFSLN